MLHVGIIGLGRMGENMSRRLLQKGFTTYGYRTSLDKLKEQEKVGYISLACADLPTLVKAVKAKQKRGVFQIRLSPLKKPFTPFCLYSLKAISSSIMAIPILKILVVGR